MMSCHPEGNKTSTKPAVLQSPSYESWAKLRPVLLVWESHTMTQNHSWAQVMETLTLMPVTGAQRGIICSVLVIQYCCLGANEGWISSQFPLLNKKANGNTSVNFSNPQTQQTKLTEHWETIQQWIWASYIYKSCYITGSCYSDRLSCPNPLTSVFRSTTLYWGGLCKEHLQGNKGLK